jgi:23S rRNA (pseudouridine1915-N3)-methyltransferase
VRISVAAVGKLREAHWRAAADEYRKRLSRYATVDVVEVSDRDLSAGGPERAVEAEGVDLLRAIRADSHVIALEIGGTERTSQGLAARLEALMLAGTSDVTFVVGGSAGIAPAVLARADERLSLSRMTLPHQLCRVVLLEQIYRAFRIIRNEPYHL